MIIEQEEKEKRLEPNILFEVGSNGNEAQKVLSVKVKNILERESEDMREQVLTKYQIKTIVAKYFM